MSSIATNEEEKAPYYGTKNNDLPRKDLFRELRKRWQFKTGRTASALAEILEITPQACAAYANNSPTGRSAPLWAIIRLCYELDLALAIHGDGVVCIPVDSLQDILDGENEQ
ncbi:MAG TPA: hypothetical protein EYN67_06700 [Flavobacteriales bacterium]|nr:hypothetical protein [Flavobacteriales bacterium]